MTIRVGISGVASGGRRFTRAVPGEGADTRVFSETHPAPPPRAGVDVDLLARATRRFTGAARCEAPLGAGAEEVLTSTDERGYARRPVRIVTHGGQCPAPATPRTGAGG